VGENPHISSGVASIPPPLGFPLKQILQSVQLYLNIASLPHTPPSLQTSCSSTTRLLEVAPRVPISRNAGTRPWDWKYSASWV